MGEQVELTFDRQLLSPNPPKLAQKFGFTRVGPDIVFEVGFFEPTALREALERLREKQPSPPVPYLVTDRFVLSLSAVVDLFNVSKMLIEGLRADPLLSRLLPSEESDETPAK